MKPNPVVHFEMPYEDRDRMAEFYKKAFGWQAQMLGKEMGNYVVVTTTETDKDRMVKTPGTINGGFYEKSKDNQHPSVVVAVDDIRKSIQQVIAAGGKVLGGKNMPGEPDEIPGVGLYASFIDTEGNRVSMLQPRSVNK